MASKRTIAAKGCLIFILTAFTAAQAGAQRTELPAHTPETILRHAHYTSSYNPDRKTPNYVSYTLLPEMVTKDGVSREGEEFLPDPLLGEKAPTTRDYSRSGWSRGHMKPAADCKWDAEAMRESFYIGANICPQDATLNETTWCDLEKQVRFWCKYFYKTQIHVICGPVTGPEPQRIGASGIAVPEGFFKVIWRNSDRDGTMKAIGFLMPNAPTDKDYGQYAVSIDTIEEVTGIDFFSDLDEKLARTLEEKPNTSDWKL